jgi:hypothetical protein
MREVSAGLAFLQEAGPGKALVELSFRPLPTD